MIDKDDSGTLEKQEVIDAVSADKKVINFLVNCGEPNLQYLLVPARLESALQQLATARAGHIDAQEWCCRSVLTSFYAVSDSLVACYAGRTPSRTRCRTSSRSAR